MAYETPAEIAERVRRQQRTVVIHDCKYGYIDRETGEFTPYTVNPNNTVLNPVYEHYKRINGIYGAPSDKQRVDWEKPLKKLLCVLFKEMYHYKLDKLFNDGDGVQSLHNQYQERQLEELVAMQDPQELIQILYGGKK